MRAFYLTLATALVTFLLMLVGGIVHVTGSSLACPDWPLCYGQVFPEMTGGVLYEHSHRLLGSLVGGLTLALCITLLKRWRGQGNWFAFGLVVMGLELSQLLLMGGAVSGTRHPTLLLVAFVLTLAILGLLLVGARLAKDRLPLLGLLALEVVVVQGLLGGLTVVLKLPTAVSTTHLATAFFFFAFLAYVAWRVYPRAETALTLTTPLIFRGPIVVAMLGVYLQSILGALVRHTGSGMACGDTLLTCMGQFAPTNGPAHLNLTHRVLAIIVMVIVAMATVKPIRAAKKNLGDPRSARVRKLSVYAHALVTTQVLLGLLTVLTHINIAIVSAHLGVAALLLADLAVLYVTLGPTPENVVIRVGAPTSSPNLAQSQA